MSPELGRNSGCETAADNAAGANLLDWATAKGADCAGGFEDPVKRWADTEFCQDFWQYTMLEGDFVDAAAIQAIANLWAENDGDDGGCSSWISRGNLTLRPSRWGN